MRPEFQLSFMLDSIKGDSVRSALTLIGVFLGVITAVLIIGVGEGIIKSANEIFATFGTDKLIIAPISDISNPSAFGKLSLKDAQALKTLPYVERVMYGAFTKARVEYKEDSIQGNVFLMTPNTFEAWKDLYHFRTGRPFKENERRAVVLGGVAATEFFSEEVKAGKYITINGERFRVVGTLEPIGQAFSSTDDESIYITYEASPLFNLAKDELSYIALDLYDGAPIDDIQKQAEILLARRRGVSLDNKDFIIISQKYFQETTGNILSVINIGAVAVGLIASIVSAVGIANTMFTSILRKKRQIGILRAIGAKKKDLLLLFMAEAVFLSLIGSISALLAGLILGLLISPYVPFAISPLQFIAAFLVGIVIGVLGGFLPARRATEISPLEAIKY